VVVGYEKNGEGYLDPDLHFTMSSCGRCGFTI